MMMAIVDNPGGTVSLSCLLSYLHPGQAGMKRQRRRQSTGERKGKGREGGCKKEGEKDHRVMKG